MFAKEIFKSHNLIIHLPISRMMLTIETAHLQAPNGYSHINSFIFLQPSIDPHLLCSSEMNNGSGLEAA